MQLNHRSIEIKGKFYITYVRYVDIKPATVVKRNAAYSSTAAASGISRAASNGEVSGKAPNLG